MVDRAARDQFVELIRHLAAGQISNDEFEDRVPRSQNDPAIGAVFWNGAWLLYDDLRQYKLVGKCRLPKEARREVARWVLFLESDLEYEWPRLLGVYRFPGYVLNVITLGAMGWMIRTQLHRRGDASVWPFMRCSDYEAALAKPPYLAGAL